jgi:hypothetical protein
MEVKNKEALKQEIKNRVDVYVKEFPIIIESFCDGLEKMEEELEYIKERL